MSNSGGKGGTFNEGSFFMKGSTGDMTMINCQAGFKVGYNRAATLGFYLLG